MQKLTALFFCLVAFSFPSFAQTAPMPGGFADLVEKLSPAVVNISTAQKVKQAQGRLGSPFPELPNNPEFDQFRDFFERFGQMQGQPQEREVFSLGSGFIIDAKGYVITNNHVIDDAQDITVTLPDNTKYKAKLVGRDSKTDLALLKVETKNDMPFVVMGDSDAMRVGDWVIAIGNPFGLGGTVTQGIISARARSINSGPFDDFLQTDAPINRGNSGGPLFNTKGEVIGINSAIFSPSGGSVGIGFAIPTSLAKSVIEQLKAKGHVTRGWLGVKIQEVSDEVAESVGMKKEMGAIVLEVTPNSPAAKAGILPGDIITSFGGKDISEMRNLPRLVADTKIGQTVTVTYWRKDVSKTAQVTIGELKDDQDDISSQDDGTDKPKGKRGDAQTLIGMELVPLTAQVRQELRLDDKVTGVAVADVAGASEAMKRGVKAGDVIVDVGGDAVKTPDDVKKAFAKVKSTGRKFALVHFMRGKTEAFVALPVEEKK